MNKAWTTTPELDRFVADLISQTDFKVHDGVHVPGLFWSENGSAFEGGQDAKPPAAKYALVIVKEQDLSRFDEAVDTRGNRIALHLKDSDKASENKRLHYDGKKIVVI